MNKNYYKTI